MYMTNKNYVEAKKTYNLSENKTYMCTKLKDHMKKMFVHLFKRLYTKILSNRFS